MGRSTYDKPWLSICDQVQKLIERGLTIGDTAEAERFLRHTNYYRFTGYCRAFEIGKHRFRNTTFEQIVDAYRFDDKLRDLLTEALKLVEVDLRTSVAHHFGNRHGPFGHTSQASFHPRFDLNISHADWLSKVQGETDRSSEMVVKHFKVKYLRYPDLPIWVATEVMSLGCLSREILSEVVA
ncbi:MAG: Abi family protein [Planctomycetota bacterium]|nr:Abi family protein [Planctomycetota bacterium]MDA1160897.1 Abi family protein [Planctomycetota bacterium]